MVQKREKIEEIKNDLRRWYGEGYVMDPIFDSLRRKDVSEFVRLYKKYKKLIPEMKRYGELLKDYDDPQSVRYKKMLKNPLEFEENLGEIEEYIKKKKELEESEDAIFNLLAGVKSEEFKSGLNPNFTFENYVLHEGNELAYTAASKILETPGSINPLIFIGESGTGKTHLLNAIGNEYAKNGLKVIYKNSEEIILERNINFDADVLLLDDFHLLLEREEMHPLINLLVENFSKEGKQIVLASNFKIRYYAMEPSLRSKLEAGISIELSHPPEDARIRILTGKAEEMNISVDREVLLYLAKNISNLSRLVAALKKVVAFSKILGEKPSISMVADMLKSRISLQPGISYLIEEEKPYRSVNYLKETIDRGYAPLIITRMNPKRFEQLYGISTNVYWLTDHTTDLPAVSPVLENLNYFIEGYVDGKHVIYLDGLDFLMSKNSEVAVIQFIRHMVDVISESKAIFIISLNPRTIDEKHLKILEREMELA